MDSTADERKINAMFQSYFTTFSEELSQVKTYKKTIEPIKDSKPVENIINCLQLIRHQLLHAKDNNLSVMLKHPDIGPLLNCICSHSTVYMSLDAMKLLIECILWFYQNEDSESLQKRANKWVQAQLKIISGQQLLTDPSNNICLMEILSGKGNFEMMQFFLLSTLEKQVQLDAAVVTYISSFLFHFINQNGFHQQLIHTVIKTFAKHKEHITSDRSTLSIIHLLYNVIYQGVKEDKIKFNSTDWANFWYYHQQSLQEETLFLINEVLNNIDDLVYLKHKTVQKQKWLAEICAIDAFIFQTVTNIGLTLLNFTELQTPVIIFLSSLNEEIKKITPEIFHLYPVQLHHHLLCLAVSPKQLSDADLIKQHGLYILKQFLLALEKHSCHVKELIALLIAFQEWNFVFFYFLVSSCPEEFRISTTFFSLLHRCRESCIISCCMSLKECPRDNLQAYLELLKIFFSDLEKPCISFVILIFLLFCFVPKNCTSENRTCFVNSLLHSMPNSLDFRKILQWCKQEIEEKGLNCLYTLN